MATTNRRADSLGRLRFALSVLLVLVALPWRTGDVVGLFVAVSVALLAAAALTWTFKRGMLLSMTLLAAFTLVYLLGLGDAVGDGVVRIGLYASPESVLESMATMIGCAALIGLVARATQRTVLARLLARREARRRPSDEGSALRFGVAVIVGVIVVAAWTSERWSNWTQNELAASSASDGLGLPHMYAGALFLVVGLAAYARVDRTPRPRSTAAPWWTWLGWAAAFAIGACIFFLQSRRLMIAAAVLLAGAGLAAASMIDRRRLRLRVGALAVGVVMALMIFASSRWRDIDSDLEPDLIGRVERVLSDDGGDSSDVRESIEARLTYLWFDAMARDFSADTSDAVDLGTLFASEAARALPRALAPWKDDVPNVTCEAAFADLGFDEDLPCTPHTEAWMAGGLAGLALFVILWGLVLGLCEALVLSGPGLARVFGLWLFFPFTGLEGGMFPMVQGLRQAVIGTIFIGIASLVARIATRPSTPPRQSSSGRAYQ